MNLEQKCTVIGLEAYRLCTFLKPSLAMPGAGPTETEQDPVGLLGMEAFQTVANQGREGMQRRRRSSQKTTVQAWGRVLVPPQGIHITRSLSSFFVCFLNKFIYLFIYGCVGSSLWRWASHCRGFSFCRARALDAQA